jgi:hypothetical protein
METVGTYETYVCYNNTAHYHNQEPIIIIIIIIRSTSFEDKQCKLHLRDVKFRFRTTMFVTIYVQTLPVQNL